jgi:hypothetical protein
VNELICIMLWVELGQWLKVGGCACNSRAANQMRVPLTSHIVKCDY